MRLNRKGHQKRTAKEGCIILFLEQNIGKMHGRKFFFGSEATGEILDKTFFKVPLKVFSSLLCKRLVKTVTIQIG